MEHHCVDIQILPLQKRRIPTNYCQPTASQQGSDAAWHIHMSSRPLKTTRGCLTVLNLPHIGIALTFKLIHLFPAARNFHM